MNTIERDNTYIASTYQRFPIEIVAGSGSIWTGADGKNYIDMGSGIGVNAFGASDPVWKQAVIDQLNAVQHTSNLYYTAPDALLAEQLCKRTGMKKVFFSNSGAEANECAIKAARKYAAERKGADCHTIITLNNSFHGRTLTTLAATGQEHFHALFQPLTPGFHAVPAGDFEVLKEACDQYSVAAIMFECIQGEGGVLPLDAGYLQSLAAFAAERDILLIADEVQTGNGRTGKFYAYMHYGIQPDIVSTAKGLAGGLPLGATLLGEKVQNVLNFGDHGSTFGGNPVCCAAALSVLNRIDDALMQEVEEKGAALRARFEAAPGIESVTGMGLMLGLKTERNARDVVKTCMENGVLCLTAKDKVRLLPPLNTPLSLLLQAADVIIAALKEQEKDHEL